MLLSDMSIISKVAWLLCECGTGKHIGEDTLNSADATLEYNLKIPQLTTLLNPLARKSN